MVRWRDLFSPRQLLCHGTSVEVFREMLEEDRQAGRLDDVRTAAYGYLSLTIDTLLNYNSPHRDGVDDYTTKRVANTYSNRHDFAMLLWSSCRNGPARLRALGTTGPSSKTGKCIKELVGLLRARGRWQGDGQLFQSAPPVAQ